MTDIIQSFSDRNQRQQIDKSSYAKELAERYPNIDAGYVIQNNVPNSALDREKLEAEKRLTTLAGATNLRDAALNAMPKVEPVVEGEAVAADPNDIFDPNAEIQEDALYTKTPQGQDFAAASRVIYNKMFGQDSGSGFAYRGIALPMFSDREVPETDEDFARFGVEFMGQFNYNITKMGIDVAKMQGLDENTALAFYSAMTMYDRLPDFTWNGTKRMTQGIASDPTTIAGLGTLGWAFLGRSASKQTTKTAFKEYLKSTLASSTAVGAIEGGVYGGLDNYFRQQVAVDAEIQDGINLSELGTAATVGTLAGGVLGKGSDLLGDAVSSSAPVVQDALVSAGEAADDRIAARAADTGVVLNMGLDPSDAIDVIISKIGKAAKKKLSTVEIEAIVKSATKDGVVNTDLVERVSNEALRVKAEYPKSDGWLPIEANAKGKAPTFKVDTKTGSIEIKWSQPAYAFHLPKGKVKKEVHKKRLVKKTVSDVNAVLQRAQNGDQAAIDIIAQSNWYRDMRTRLRREFGGLGDVFADVLGATSAQTGVQQNYENALTVLRRFTKGEYDAEIAAYEKHIADGKPRGTAIFDRDKDENDPFTLIRKASGQMFGANSPPATEALLDMFRQVKAGKSPKTINFTGNLIGFGNQATIDVWAARYLRDIAGLPRIPPPAEKAVAGSHLAASTFEDPKIGSEFGFGQEVFKEGADLLNKAGNIAAYDPTLSKLGPDDLQAIVWFLEKEKWTTNGWTSKAGEGGSLDYESAFGGSPDRPRVAELRSVIGAKFNPPKKRQKETDEEYAARLAQATQDNTASKTAAEAELKTLEGEPQRYVAGVSMERPGEVPTNVQQLQLAEEVTAPLKTDDKVMALQANSSIGGFAGDRERNLNFEFVTQTDFNKDAVTKTLVEAGRKYDQDAVFLSKVVPDDTPDARPGVEVYFKERQGVDYAEEILAILQAKGVDGFTFVTDARQGDRALTQAATDEATAGLVGIRFQYIPEFDGDFDIARAAEIFAEKEALFKDVMDEVGKIEGITYADVVKYQTDVYKNTDRPGSEWITGGTDYGTYLGAVTGTVPGGG